MIDIRRAETTEQLDQVRGLIRGFVAWHRHTHVEDLARIERYFDPAAFEAELSGLPGHYAPPSGELLLATVDGEAAGCVAMHELGVGVCEMKRMFVPERFRGLGVGQGLGRGIVDAGRRAGYRRMQLDTSVRQVAALTLYRRLGFREVEPPEDLAEDLRGWLVFYELEYSSETDTGRNVV